jgi:mevalonate kinase
MTSVAHACGKVILLGEHAVVYGIPALAVGIDRGARARAFDQHEGPSRLIIGGWNVSVRPDESHDLARAFRAVLELASPMTPCTLDVETDLPPGGGLGCSAAMGVAIARAIQPHGSADAVQSLAMAWEQVFHGNPSGIDAAVAARGGCILFRKGEPIESVRVRGPLQLCIGNSGAASSTKAMVDGLARLRERKRELVDKSFEAIRTLVHNARLAIEAGDRVTLGRLMDLTQMLLGGLFLSTPELEHMCGLARDAGALGAKLTGAGGGGCAVALVPSRAAADAVLTAWRSQGFEGFATSVATEARTVPHESGAAP